MAEIRPHTIRHRSDAFHARTRLLEKCGGGPGNRPGAYRRFQIPVQILVGVEFRRIRRQVKQLDLLGVFGSPLADTVGAVHAQIVDDQEGAATEFGNNRTLGVCHVARRSFECPSSQSDFSKPAARLTFH